jgi:peroxiredoxin
MAQVKWMRVGEGHAKEKKMFSRSRRSFRAATISLLVVVSLVALAPLVTATPQAVNFSLRSIDGQTISSDSLRGEVVVLAFGASWLPLSRQQVQGVRKLADKYSGRGVAVFWVSTDSESPKSRNYASDEQLREFSRKYDLNVTVLRDPDGKVSKQLGVDQLPSIVILDKQGNVHGSPIGGLDPKGNLTEQLAPLLNELL